MATSVSTMARPADPPGSVTKWLISAAVLVGALMSTIDSSVVNVALVHIQATYGVTTQEVTWVSTAFLISVVLIMPLTAWLAGVIGRKRFYLLSVALFTAGSILCGFSSTLGELIAFRVLQGLGGGALLPIAQAILRESFPPEEQGQAMGMFGMIVLLGPAIGPTLGGWLTDTWSWPWIFFVNVPIGIIGLLMGMRFISDPPYLRARGLQRIDGIGIALLAVGLVAMQTMLQEGELDGWFQSGFIVTLAVATVVALVGFVGWELHVPSPAVDLRILRTLSFASGTFISAVFGFALFGSLILLPLFLQNLLGYSATQAGLALMPRSLIMVLIMPIAGALYNRVGVYVMLPVGLLLAAASAFLMAGFTMNTGELQILVPQLIQGVGFALMFVSLSTAALAEIDRPRIQNATGLFNLIRQLGGSIGTTAMITLVDIRTTTASANLVRYASSYNPIFVSWWNSFTAAFTARGSVPTVAHQQALATLYRLIEQQATVVAFDYAFAVLGIAFLVCLPLIALLRQPRSTGRPVSIAE